MIHSLFFVVVVAVVFCYFAMAVVAHPLKNILEILPSPKQHSTRLKTMNASFPADPSYLVMGITSDYVNCAESFALAYISFLLNECITSDSSSSMLVTCGKKAVRICY